MFPKIIIVVILTVVLIAMGQAAYAVPFFIIAFGIVLALSLIHISEPTRPY